MRLCWAIIASWTLLAVTAYAALTKVASPPLPFDPDATDPETSTVHSWLCEEVPYDCWRGKLDTSKANRVTINYAPSTVAFESGARFLFSPDFFPVTEVEYSFKFFVKRGFDFVLTGKLPGVMFGTCRNCSSSGLEYLPGQGSFRLTWESRGRGRGKESPVHISPYLYGAHGSFAEAKKAQGPKTLAAAEGGDRQGGFHFLQSYFRIKRGSWNTVSMYLKLNDIGKANGVVRVTVNGKKAGINDVSFRNRAETMIRSVAVVSFFGGNSKFHTTPSYPQSIIFKDITVKG